MKDDPCFHCVLPDCDESSPRCVLRKLANAYHSKRKGTGADAATDAERDAATAIFRSWQLERYAQAAEGVRPYNRSGSPWTGKEQSH